MGAYPPTGVPVDGLYKIFYDGFVVNYKRIFNVGVGVHLLYVIAAFLIIIGIKNSLLLKRLFSCKPLKWLGNLSIYIYICHFPVIWTLGAFVFYHSYLLTKSLFTSGILCWGISCMTILLISVMLKALYDRCLKEKIFRLSVLILNINC